MPGTRTHFPRLGSPFEIRGVTLRNRIVMLPTGLQFANDGAPTAEDAAFYAARARGGTGLVIGGGTVVHPSSVRRSRTLFEAFRPEYIERFAAVADAVHAEGGKIFGQILHLGRESVAGGDAELAPVAPSPIPSKTAPRNPHELNQDEIDELIDGFVTSAGHLLAAGYDGIELHGAHGYLIHQFLSPLSNRRTDIYGGDHGRRTRFVVDIATRIRELHGHEFPLGVRLTVDEERDGGIRPAEAGLTASILEASGLIDYLSIAIGVRGAYVKDMSHGHGLSESAAATIRAESGLPLLLSQRITRPETAEQLLASGNGQLIGLARGLIADPEWANKALAGDTDRIILCVGCMQLCRGQAGQGGVSCVHNPRSGRELRSIGSPTGRSKPRQRVLVVGGGPGGLEAARVAAGEGHEVVVLERQPVLGGQIRLASGAPTRGEMAEVVDFRERELGRLGVEIRLGVHATADLVVDEAADVTVVATGAGPGRPTFSVEGDLPTMWDVLRGDIDPAGQTAIVIDDGTAFWETASTVEWLVARGMRVTAVTPATHLAAGIPSESIPPLYRRLGDFVAQHPFGRVVRASGQSVELDGGEIYSADLTVLAGPKRARNELLVALEGQVPRLEAVGDCMAPRRLEHAMLDAHRIAATI